MGANDATVGGALVLGGIAIAFHKRWGFLILGSTMVLPSMAAPLHRAPLSFSMLV
jgi:hypothetical protein